MNGGDIFLPRKRLRCLSAIIFGVLALSLPQIANADAPPFEYRSPANGSQVVMPASSTTGISVEFACPGFEGFKGGHQNWSSYSARFATSPELNPQGELATPFRIWISSAHPINAAEDICQAELSYYYAHRPATYYWQLERIGCFAPECTNKLGPVWSFTVLAPVITGPPAPPVSKGGTPFTSYFACGRSKNARQATTCPHGGRLGAFFRSPIATSYSLCIRFPSGQRECASNQAAEAGVLYVNKVFGHQRGWYKAVWTSGGKRSVKHLKRT